MSQIPEKVPAFNQPLPSTPAAVSAARPPVIGWYKAYAAFMAVLYFGFMILGFALLQYSPQILQRVPEISSAELKIRTLIILVSGIALFIGFVVALVLPKSPAAWIYHIVMIAFGLSICCLWPVTIPLMIAWMKPSTQQYFGRNDASISDPNLPPPPIPHA